MIDCVPEDVVFKKYVGKPEEGPDCIDIVISSWSAKTGRRFHEDLIPHDKNAEGDGLPYGWDLDFSKCPAHYQPQGSLERWISARSYSW